MAYVDINSLNTTTVGLSDIFDVYTLSGTRVYPSTINFSDLSGYFYDQDTFVQLSAKYDELLSLMVDFKTFMDKNYPKTTDLNNILTTAAYLSATIDQLMTIDKAKRDYLNEYCTYEYADYKKNLSHKYHETLANALGRQRASILNQVVLETYEPEEEE